MQVVIDTGFIVSALLKKAGTSRRALNIVLASHTILISLETISELVVVLDRPKFEKYFDDEDKIHVLGVISLKGKYIEVTSDFKLCRDPNDDIFLNLAIDGKADVIISRDPDLLVPHPFKGIPILSPADFLHWVENQAKL